MNRPLVDTGLLNRILSSDSSAHQPRDSVEVFTPVDSWSGATFVRWRAERGRLMAKIWPADGPELAMHQLRHRVLEDLGDFEPMLAIPVPDLTGRTLRVLPDGRVAEVFVWLEGAPSTSNPSQNTIGQVFRAIARLHLHWSRRFGQNQGFADSVRQRLAALKEFRASGIRKAREDVRRDRFAFDAIRTRFDEIIDLADKLIPIALDRLTPVARRPLPLQFVMRDVRPNHFLWNDTAKQRRANPIPHDLQNNDNIMTYGNPEEPILCGIVDFGAIGIDTVAADLARLMGEWNLFDPTKRSVALDAYESIRPLEPAEVAAIEPLALAAAILGGLAWIDLHFRQKRTMGREDALLTALTHAENRLRTQYERHRT